MDTYRDIEYYNTCDTNMTIEHMLIIYPDLQNVRCRILSHLNNLNFDFNEYNIHSDKFNHNILFDFLK